MQDIKSLKAVLFDFDGTLGDSYPAITASVNYVRSLYGMPPLEEAEVRRHVGRGAPYLLEHTVPAGSIEANTAAYRAHHPSVLRSGTRLMRGVAVSVRAAAPAAGRWPGARRRGGAGTRPRGRSRSLARRTAGRFCRGAI